MYMKTFVALAMLVASPVALADVLPYCSESSADADGDGFGYENGQSCVAFLPDLTPPLVSVGIQRICLTDSDPDGDGYGWEENQSCVTIERMIDDSSENTEIARDSEGYPVCSDAIVDEDGDGFGYENRRSCRFGVEVAYVTTGSRTPGELITESAPIDPESENSLVDNTDGALLAETGLTDADGAAESSSLSASSLDTEELSDLEPGDFDVVDLDTRVCESSAIASSGSLVLDNAVYDEGDEFWGYSTQCMEVVNGTIQWRYNYPTFGTELAGYPSAKLVSNPSDPIPTISYNYNSIISGSDAYIAVEADFSDECTGSGDYQVTYYLSGSPSLGSTLGTTTIDGKSWDVYPLQDSSRGISLVSSSSATAGEFDLSVLTQQLQSGAIPGAPDLGENPCLVSAQIGTPIYSGFGTFTLQKFSTGAESIAQDSWLLTDENGATLPTPTLASSTGTQSSNSSLSSVSGQSSVQGNLPQNSSVTTIQQVVDTTPGIVALSTTNTPPDASSVAVTENGAQQLEMVPDADSEVVFDQDGELSVDFACERCENIGGFRLTWDKNPPDENVEGYNIIFADGSQRELATAVATVSTASSPDDYLLFNVDDHVAAGLNAHGGGCAWIQAYKGNDSSDFSDPACFTFPDVTVATSN